MELAQKTQIVYRSRKPSQAEVAELLSIIPSLDIDFVQSDSKIQSTIDPIYKIKTLDWTWLRSLFTADNDVECLMLDKKELTNAGIHDHWGFYYLDDDTNHQFYITDLGTKLDKRAVLNGFKSNFAWMFTHEYLHGGIWGELRDRNKAAVLVHEWEAQGKLLDMAKYYSTQYASLSKQVGLLSSVVELFKKLFKINMPETLLHPVEDYKNYITQGYGVANKIYTLTQHHQGTDYACPINTPVKAPWDGEIVVAGYSKALGYHCHYQYTYRGQQYTDRYLHLLKIPTVGKYKCGSIVARTGDSGMSSNPHIHIDTWLEDVDLTSINKNNWSTKTVDQKTHYV